MIKTKIPIKKKRFALRFASLFLSLLAFLVVFFELMLTLHGGWADINYSAIFVAPFFAALGLLLAIFNVVKFRSKGRELVPALSMVVISAFFFCYIMVYMSRVLIAQN